MKFLKKTLALVLSLLCIAAVFSACADDTADNSSSVKSSLAKNSSADSSSESGASNVSSNSSSSDGIDYSKYSKEEKESLEKYGHIGNVDIGYEIMEGEREAWLWPFTRTSCWNMPIGSNAVYEPAGLREEDEISADGAIMITTQSTDEKLWVMQNGSGNYDNRWPDKSQLRKQINWMTNQQVYTYWPRGKVIAAGGYDNDCCTILQPNGRNIVETQPTCRAEADSDYLVGNVTLCDIDIYNDIGNYGSHWGSAISNLGGCIRLGELTGDEPIRHAIKLNVWARRYLYPAENESDKNGFRWPASRTDTTADAKGKNPNLVEGSLLALPRDLTPENLNIRTKVGEKLFYAFQNYGAYIVDDTVRNAYAISVENGEDEAVLEKYNINLRSVKVDKSNSLQEKQSRLYRQDMMKIITNLQIIVNNTIDNVGGGGTPCQPLAPNLPSLK